MPDVDFRAQVDAHVRRVVRAEMAVIERACEAALVGGQYGVLVRRKTQYDLSDPSALRATGFLEASVDPAVPYGQIRYETDVAG